ncbi:PREDICTED: eukaryotic translation initiation factor 4 gamma 1 isoform X3 [Polistes dominula]|uniref:Eukaryotic translation initiation factor 4 gamma 1 isoform X3 n=1 Tax=Polistes dominula TaxID=743375 RepID=A0ABM1IIQ7_POLDO|nr:PREDICTED: eukaryotic translation initiation factor 4 gamma 1 isoform X3 [Polistes dominula]
MVSRFGVSKEGGVDVAAVGTMQCILGPHHHHHYPAPHPQNPQPGHHVHHATHPPPPSPSPHLNHQLSHHQIAVNINQIGQQLGHQAPPLRVFTQNNYRFVLGSEFHAGNYGAQPGGQVVGGGGGSVGVPGGRGPPLGGLPLGQSTAGIPPGGPAGGQAPPQAQAPGIQAQQSQGPAPTTTPPVHTPSPQEMGKSTHMQTHNYYSAAPRPQQPRNLNHRGGQGGTNNQVVGMAGVAGGAGQPPVMYTAGLTSQPGAVFVPSHVAGIPTGPHQQSVYHMNNQLIQFSSAPQRHQTQGQSYYPPYQPHALLTQNIYPYQAGPAPQPSFFYASPTAPLGINRSSATAVSGGAQHVGGTLGGAQGAAMVPQGTLQQTTQQPQPLPQIVPGYYKDYNLYSGYNGGSTTGTNSSIRSKKPRGERAITDIVNPSTGKNISHEIYDDDTSVEHESNSRETPQLQNSSGAEVVADFAARVAKAATESSDSGSPVPVVVTTPETTFVPQITTQSLSNIKTTTNGLNSNSNNNNNNNNNNSSSSHSANSSSSSNNNNNNNNSLATQSQNMSKVHALCNQSLETPCSQNKLIPTPSGTAAAAAPSCIVSPSATTSLTSSTTAMTTTPLAATISSTAPVLLSSSSSPSPSSCAIKTTTAVESKPLQFFAKEFHPRGEKKTTNSNEEIVAVVNDNNIPPAQPMTTTTTTTTTLASTTTLLDQEVKRTTSPPSVNVQPPPPPPPSSAPQHHQPQQQQPQQQQPHHHHQQQHHHQQSQHNYQQQSVHQTQQQQHAVSNVVGNIPEVSSKPSSNAAAVNPTHIREQPFTNNSQTTAPKTNSPPNKSNSPPRRKSSQSHNNANNANSEPLANAKELREKKREKSINSRNVTTTPAPAHNQPDHHHHHHHHHHHQKTNGDANGEKSEQEAISLPPPIARNEVPSKATEGKVMQKQKNKNKLKPRDLNRKGAEKEGTDMDAFMNKLDNKITSAKETFVTKENKDFANIEENAKDNKDTDNKESSTEKETTTTITTTTTTTSNAVYCKTSKNPVRDVEQESNNEQLAQATNIERSQDDKEVCNTEVSSNVEDHSQINVTSPITTCSNAQIKSVPNNDVVDHAIVVVKDNIDVETIVAQKNEENTKMSTLQQQQQQQQQSSSPDEEKVVPSVPTVEKSNESSEQQQQPQQQTTQQSTPTSPTTVDASKNSITLKYTYKDDQWSPINKDGKKVYDREFLIRLQDDPNSKIKPNNLPDLEVVLKDNKNRPPMDFRSFKDTSMSRPDSLFPVFVKSSGLARGVPPANRKSLPPGKPKTNNQKNMIHLSLSLREDVKLRETENAWKPARLKQLDLSEEEAKTLQLYKRVRSVLNKLTPQKFSTLVDQVRALNIDTQERLQGVINLVFEKAVDEPSFSVAYALMCKELAMMEASGGDKSGTKPTESSVNFRKLIVSRCQKEFEKNPLDEVTRTNKLKEIDECTDPEKKKDLLLQLEEEERRIRIKSVGNIRFIGELYKQGMLTTGIMHRCIVHLLDQNDEDSLECLCKLLTTIGKDLESKSKMEEMQDYFCKMSEIVSRRGQSKISSRIRFMLQDVIDLRANKWVPRRDDSNPKTIDQIQKEVESERLDTQLTNTPLNAPRKDDRNADRKRNRGFGATDEGGWCQAVGRARPQTYSVETAKLRQKTTPVDDLILGSRNYFMWKTSTNNTKNSTNKFALLENINTIEQDRRMPPLPLSGSRSTGPRDYGRDYKSSYDGRSSRNGSHQLSSGGASSSRESSLLDNAQSQSVSMPTQSLKSSASSPPVTSNQKPPLSEEEFDKVFNSILKDYLREHSLENAISDVIQTFDNTTFTKFVRESINYVLEKSPPERERVSRLMLELIKKNVMPLQHLKAGFSEVLELVDDLIIDIPRIWTYLAEVLTHPLKEEIMPLSEMNSIFISLKSQGGAGKLLGELLAKLCQEKGSKWVADKWDQSRLSINDIIDSERESIDKIAKEYHLEFLIGDYNSAKSSNKDELSLQQIHEHLRKLMKEKSFDQINNWITEFVDDRVKDPKFIRILMTAILETSIVSFNDTWKLNENTFSNLQNLIHRYVDTDEVLELQCLYAIQAYMTKIEFPLGILRSVINKLSGDNIISSDAFLAWQKGEDPAEHEGHSVAIMTLTAFFTSLQEADDSSSVEDGTSNVNSDHF